MRASVLATGRAEKKLPHWALLDGLRLIAALMVVLYHYVGGKKHFWGGPMAEQWPVLHGIAAFGNLGVPLFFIISGLVVFRSLEGRSTSRFIGSRVGRVMPAFWLSVLVAGPLQMLVWDYKDLDWSDVWMNLTLMGPPVHGELSGDTWYWVDTVYWTLWIEARFYIMLVLGRWALRVLRLNHAGGWTAFCLAWVGLSAWVIHDQGIPELQSWVSWLIFPTYAGLFAGGMLLYLIAAHGFTWVRGAALVAAVVQAAWATAKDLPVRTEGVTGLQIPGALYALAVGLCFATITAIVFTRLDRVSWAWLTTAGALSYPVYLLHDIAGRFIIESLSPWMPKLALLLLLVAAMLGASWLVNRFVEQPLGPRLNHFVAEQLDRVVGLVTARRARWLLQCPPVRVPETTELPDAAGGATAVGGRALPAQEPDVVH